MGSPVGPVRINVGDKIRGQWIVRKKLGEGSCGIVLLMQSLAEGKKAAMKVEPFMKCKDDEILKMEVYVLRKLQKSKHVCRLYCAGKGKNYSFVIMSLLGKELADIRRRLPDRRMSSASVLKIGLQSLQAIRDMHSIGFVHRDVKPTNFAMGHSEKNTVFIFDFGLSRQLLLPDKNGVMKIREPREKVSFRGTVRYCSLNVHHYKEQGRHDDLWSMLYMLIELVTATLPWKGLARRESARLKEVTSDRSLLLGCPKSFFEINAHLKRLTYYDTPNYDLFKNLFANELVAMHVKISDPFEWNVEKTSFNPDLAVIAEKDKSAEIDKGANTGTNRVVDRLESVESVTSDPDSQLSGFARENTLDDAKSDSHQ